jgi:hypothetical protein
LFGSEESIWVSMVILRKKRIELLVSFYPKLPEFLRDFFHHKQPKEYIIVVFEPYLQ